MASCQCNVLLDLSREYRANRGYVGQTCHYSLLRPVRCCHVGAYLFRTTASGYTIPMLYKAYEAEGFQFLVQGLGLEVCQASTMGAENQARGNVDNGFSLSWGTDPPRTMQS